MMIGFLLRMQQKAHFHNPLKKIILAAP